MKMERFLDQSYRNNAHNQKCSNPNVFVVSLLYDDVSLVVIIVGYHLLP